MFVWCRRRDSNPQPAGLESAASCQLGYSGVVVGSVAEGGGLDPHAHGHAPASNRAAGRPAFTLQGGGGRRSRTPDTLVHTVFETGPRPTRGSPTMRLAGVPAARRHVWACYLVSSASAVSLMRSAARVRDPAIERGWFERRGLGVGSGRVRGACNGLASLVERRTGNLRARTSRLRRVPTPVPRSTDRRTIDAHWVGRAARSLAGSGPGPSRRATRTRS